jgi:hypothetical protein
MQGRTGDVPGTIEWFEADVDDRGRRRRVTEQLHQVGRRHGFCLVPGIVGTSGRVLARDERPHHPDTQRGRDQECPNAAAATALGHGEIL